jgi:hypothetical protein
MDRPEAVDDNLVRWLLDAGGSMNFEEAVSVHLKWKIRLRMVIEGHSDEELDPNVVGKDDQCDLGIWIQGDGGRTMAAKPEFAQLKSLHAEFHQVTGSVLRKALGGDKTGAQALLNGDFNRASTKVMQALTHCRAACK